MIIKLYLIVTTQSHGISQNPGLTQFYTTGSPVKAEDLLMKRRMTDNIFADPRPVKYRNNPGFCDRVRNMVFNYCSRSSENLAFRYLYSQANIQVFREYMYCNSFQHMYSFETS